MEIAESKPETIQEYQKSQAIRIIDVAIIGPILIYAGYKSQDLNKIVRIALIIIGISTIYYNGKNYMINVKTNSKK